MDFATNSTRGESEVKETSVADRLVERNVVAFFTDLSLSISSNCLRVNFFWYKKATTIAHIHAYSFFCAESECFIDYSGI